MNARDARPPRLAGKVAIVTGAAPSAPGIGNGTAAAILFAREGAKVLLVNRSQSRAEVGVCLPGEEYPYPGAVPLTGSTNALVERLGWY
jgi:NAD(P)-dependent dehydrogenase (short-subunit alcohol dehydrogenase family)